MADRAVSDDPAVQAQLDRLALLSPGSDILGLERISALLGRLGNPQDLLPPVFHVAGTNGGVDTPSCAPAWRRPVSTPCLYQPHLVRFNDASALPGG